MARVCVFCGNPGVTREHALPRWLARVLVSEFAPPDFGRFEVGDDFAFERLVRETAKIDITVRRVCQACNGGWMAQLEAQTEPLATPMILGNAKTLTDQEQEILAFWATKTAMMLAFTHPEDERAAAASRPEWIGVPEAHYHALFREQRPPTHTFVGLAAYEHSQQDPAERRFFAYRHEKYELKFDSGRPGGGAGHASTFNVGHLVFQVIGHDVGEQIGEINELDAKWRGVYWRIWPLGGDHVTWPPTLWLDDSGFDSFAKPFTVRSIGPTAATG